MKELKTVVMNIVHITEEKLLVLLDNGMYAELNNETDVLTLTGESIPAGQVPPFDDSSWWPMPCFIDESAEIKERTVLNMYFVQINGNSILVLLKNGTYAVLDTLTDILTSTGEAISPDELPSSDDSSWWPMACYPDSSLVI